MSDTNTIEIITGPLEIVFTSKHDWINRSPRIWRKAALRDTDAICVDAKGRICQMGKHFQRAENDDSYPIKVYRKNPLDDNRQAAQPLGTEHESAETESGTGPQAA